MVSAALIFITIFTITVVPCVGVSASGGVGIKKIGCLWAQFKKMHLICKGEPGFKPSTRGRRGVSASWLKKKSSVVNFNRLWPPYTYFDTYSDSF